MFLGILVATTFKSFSICIIILQLKQEAIKSQGINHI